MFYEKKKQRVFAIEFVEWNHKTFNKIIKAANRKEAVGRAKEIKFMLNAYDVNGVWELDSVDYTLNH